MKKTNIKEVIEQILQIPRIAKRITKFALTQEQLEANVIVLIEILNDQQETTTNKSFYDLTFEVDQDNNLILAKELSKFGKEKLITENIITQELYPIDTTIKLVDMDRNLERLTIADFLKEYKKNFNDNPKGFYLYGSMGVGKTFIAQAMANALAQKDFKVAFLNVVELISILKTKFNTGIDNFINQLKNVDHLFLDDLGAETIVPWFRDEILLSLLSYRMINNKSTFFTSNFDYQQLEKIESKAQNSRYLDATKAKRLLERIKFLSVPIFIKGHNRRY